MVPKLAADKPCPKLQPSLIANGQFLSASLQQIKILNSIGSENA